MRNGVSSNSRNENVSVLGAGTIPSVQNEKHVIFPGRAVEAQLSPSCNVARPRTESSIRRLDGGAATNAT
jgi:hypothetical protein